jgi:hypothetical protein
MDNMSEGDILWNPRTQVYLQVVRESGNETVYHRIYPHDGKLKRFWREIKRRLGITELPVTMDDHDCPIWLKAIKRRGGISAT